MEDAFTVEKVMEWLRSKGTTSWGGHGWTVTKDDTCKQAAEWFMDQMSEYFEYVYPEER